MWYVIYGMWTGNQTGTAVEIHVELLPAAVAGGLLTGLFWAVLSTILLCFFEHLTTVTISLSLPLTTRMNPNGNPNYRHYHIKRYKVLQQLYDGEMPGHSSLTNTLE